MVYPPPLCPHPVLLAKLTPMQLLNVIFVPYHERGWFHGFTAPKIHFLNFVTPCPTLQNITFIL